MSAAPDPGLQAQRTALAWHRTGLAVLVNALVILRSGVSTGQPLLTVLGALLLAGAAGVAAGGVWRSRALSLGPHAAATPVPLMRAVAGVTVLAATAGVGALALA